MKQRIIDQVEFLVKAGNGGKGIVSFRREKYIPKGGPDGGDGGNGGSIYFVANPHMTTLLDYAGKDKFMANNGESGRPRRQHGKDAEDVVMEVPVGTVVFAKSENDKSEVESQKSEWLKIADLNEPGMKAMVAMGGAGGRGNDAFKSSTNTTPMYSEPGQRGEEKYLRLELKTLADIGLVGLPNAGKSTLLSVLTAARPEIANYPFTTITPNLGVMETFDREIERSRGRNEDDSAIKRSSERTQLIIADIPGLIEDAHKGKGLGTQFLRHIERCRVLAYVIGPMEEDLAQMTNDQAPTSKLIEQFETVKNEVASYGQGVIDKKRLVVINKADLLTEEMRQELVKTFEEMGEEVVVVSAATTEGIDQLKQSLAELF